MNPAGNEPHQRFAHLVVRRLGAVASVEFARPPVNALSFAALAELATCLRELGAARDVHVVVLHGQPPHFCAGNDRGDLAHAAPDELTAGIDLGTEVFELIQALPQVTIAVLTGAVLGSGFILSALCDIRVAARGCRIGLPEVTVGTFGGYRIARERLPSGEARLLALAGRPLDSERAYELGFVQLLVDADALSVARELAEEIAECAASAVDAQAVPGLRASDAQPMMAGHLAERMLAERLLRPAEPKEGG